MYFYYDTIGTTIPTEGYIDGDGNFQTTDTTRLPYNVVDNNIETFANFISPAEGGLRLFKASYTDAVYNEITETYDVIQLPWNLYSSVDTVNFIALYVRTIHEANPAYFNLYGSSEAYTEYELLDSFEITTTGWYYLWVGNHHKPYYVAQFSGKYDVDIGHFLMGNRIELPYTPKDGWEDLYINEHLNMSYTGNEYANQTKEILGEYGLEFPVITWIQQVNLMNMIRNIAGKNFLWVDQDSVERFVNFVKVPKFTRIGYKAFSTFIQLREFQGSRVQSRAFAPDWTVQAILETCQDIDKRCEDIRPRFITCETSDVECQDVPQTCIGWI